MQTLTQELKAVISRRLEAAKSHEIIEIVSQLCGAEEPVAFSFTSPVAAARFTQHDGIIEDATTGLLWTAADVGNRANGADAKKAADGVTLGGFTDWRLPTIRELQSLVDFERHSPAADPIFSLKADWYWTSTPYASSPGVSAWFVAFYGGSSSWGYQDGEGLVRAVRPRQ